MIFGEIKQLSILNRTKLIILGYETIFKRLKVKLLSIMDFANVLFQIRRIDWSTVSQLQKEIIRLSDI